jgi:hypothetical protein
MFRNLDYTACRMLGINQYFITASEKITIAESIHGEEEQPLFDKSHLIIGNHFPDR